MRVACVGGGPAGLYFAISMKLRSPDHEISVFERNPAGVTSGWGVVFWQEMLDELTVNDPHTAQQIAAGAFRWVDQVVDVEGKETLQFESTGYSIGRQLLLDILTARALQLGVRVEFDSEVSDESRLDGMDVVVAADGVNSRLRQARNDAFGTTIASRANKYLWLSTTKVFDSFTFPFVKTEGGWIWIHAYGFESGRSTCIVECTAATWAALGFDHLGLDETLVALGIILEGPLDGHPLQASARTDGSPPWLSFMEVTNDRWHVGNVVLVGDSAHTTHFSIGSGTRLALEDAMCLAAELDAHSDVPTALESYGQKRRAAISSTQREARNSARWLEHIDRYIDLPARHFAILISHRTSSLFARIPPKLYPYRLHLASQEIAALRKLKSWVGSGLGAVSARPWTR